MARLRRESDGKTWIPLPESLVGRSGVCTLQLDEPDVSKEHASLRWDGAHWELRDLNSRNGTFSAGRRLGAGEDVKLLRESTIRFGRGETWIVEDDGPPPLMAVRTDGRQRAAVTSILALPDDENPDVTVFLDSQGRWVMERDGEAEEVADGAEIEIESATWRLLVPGISERTAEPADDALSLAHATFHFLVSQDEEHVALRVSCGGRDVDLRDRAHHYLTLTLARLRQKDADEGVAPAECGWVYHADLQKMLSATRNHVNVTVHRIRKQLEEVGFIDAAGCIERRLSTGQLRLGVTRVEVIPSGG